MSNKQPVVGIIMGSQSDYVTMKLCQKVLKRLRIKCETKTDNEGKGFSAKLWSIDLTGYNERLIDTETDASDPSWSSLLSN